MNNLKGMLIYLFANSVSSLSPLLLMPLLTEVVSPTEYAQLGIFQSLVFLFTALVGLNGGGYILRANYDRNKPENVSLLLCSAIQILLFCTLFTLVLSLILKVIFSQPNLKTSWVAICVFVSAFNYLMSLRLVQWQVKGSIYKYASLQVSLAALNLILSVFFIKIFTNSADGRIFAIFIAYLILSVFIIFSLKNEFFTFRQLFALQTGNLRKLLNFGVPLLPHVIGIFIFTSLDKIILGEIVGYSSLGIFFVAYQLSSLYRILFDAMNKAYTPYLFSILSENDDNKNRTLVINTYLILAAIFIIGFAGIFMAPYLIGYFIGEKFSSANDFLWILVIGQCFGGGYILASGYLFYHKKTWLISKITISVGCLNVLLILLLAPVFGINCAPWIFLISKIVQFIVVLYFSSKEVAIPWLKVLYE